MRRLLMPVVAGLIALATVPATVAAAGPCAQAAALGMPEGDAHDHDDPAQHRGLYCRMSKVAFQPLIKELEGSEELAQSKLGEIDVKADILAIAIQEPIGGVLFFDVSDPAQPRFLSRYLHAACGLGDNCGAYVELTADGKYALLSVQQTDLMPGLFNGRSGQSPGVALIDLTDPAAPRLSQEYVTASVQGVHTTRTHANTVGPHPGEYAYIIQNGVGVEIARIGETAAGRQMVRVNNLVVPDAENTFSVHDTFIQTDPIDNRVYLYMAGGFTFGFRVYDVTNPNTPFFVAEWDPTPECVDDWYAHTIDVTLRAGRRLVTMPAEQFNFGAPSNAGGATCGAQSGNGDQRGTMWIVDATDMSKLAREQDDAATVKQKSEQALLTTWRTPGDRAAGQLTFSAHNQQIVGNEIYLSHYHGGVFVLDASEVFAGGRSAPAEAGWAVPFDEPLRPTLNAGTFPHSRGDFWDAVYYRGHVLAVDIKGGLYTLRYAGADARAGGGSGGSDLASCEDRTPPRSYIERLTVTRRAIEVRGRARDEQCDEVVTRVLVSVAHKKRARAKRCRFLRADGRLQRPRRCGSRTWLTAKGEEAFSLRIRGRLRRGTYQVAHRAIDIAGNVEATRLKHKMLR